MKYLSVAILVALISLSSTNAGEKEKHLFILSGQSNMARLDPNISFTPAVETAFGENTVTVVKDAKGGRPIRRWHKKWKPAQGDEPKATGDLYDRLMKKVKASIKGFRSRNKNRVAHRYCLAQRCAQAHQRRWISI